MSKRAGKERREGGGREEERGERKGRRVRVTGYAHTHDRLIHTDYTHTRINRVNSAIQESQGFIERL